MPRQLQQQKKEPRWLCKTQRLYKHESPHDSANEDMNPTRMSSETRYKLRQARSGKGRCDGYSKIYNKAAHRVIAEKKLGRPLRDGDIVHHRDENKYNNNPDNLWLFSSQSAHAKHHNELRWIISEIKKIEKEVMLNEIRYHMIIRLMPSNILRPTPSRLSC
jgi:hypothetical protein